MVSSDGHSSLSTPRAFEQFGRAKVMRNQDGCDRTSLFNRLLCFNCVFMHTVEVEPLYLSKEATK